ncbi:hypothetical protein IGB42_01881 [Andreprevotia sp. IGB-42]|uniref:DUF6988 family protein n=1 Tax=Andreprevotia sp. IGB-42 TaxID=2497473 RepID=UPI001359E0CF|nr:hypothetical protein [Andreprevotia sp. IGB-42]KAF0813530.1 hypothetical protein IGB42_01881 [Andreprevotia sp. IGB-42]
MSQPVNNDLTVLCVRSHDVEVELMEILADCDFPDDPRSAVVMAMSNIALEHARSMRDLVPAGRPTSALALFRLQYEALVRAAWALYAAPDAAIARLLAPLEPAAVQVASNAHATVNEMLKDLEARGPDGPYRHLASFKDYSWRSLNSFVHSGLHAVRRVQEGYPLPLLMQAIRQSNNLNNMTGLVLAGLCHDDRFSLAIAHLPERYPDCFQFEPAQQGG